MQQLRSTIVGMVAVLVMVASGTAEATVSEFIRSQTATQGQVLVEAAKAMPAERYGFAPTTDPMTFGELVLHVAVGNYLFCSRIGGIAEPSVAPLAGNAPKDALVKRLQDSFDFCSRALASLNDSKMSQVLDVGVVKTPRSMAILTLTGTWNTHVTMAHDYLSQNGRTVASHAP